MIDATKKLMVVTSTEETTDKRSAMVQQRSEFVTVGDILGATGWKAYKAFITQTGTDAPIVEVLNENDVDYLGEIGWMFDTDHIVGYLQEDGAEWTPFVVAKPVLLDDTWVVPAIAEPATVTIAGSDFAKTYVEILMKEVGAAPVLIGASVNACGTAVILVFDKAMRYEGVYEAWIDNSDITVSGGSGAGVPDNAILDGNTITLLFDDIYAEYEDTIEVTIAENKIMSFDYGRYAGVTNHAVTNVITAAPPTIVSAVVPTTGDRITVTFSKAMTPPDCAEGIMFSVGGAMTVGRIDRGPSSTILILTDLQSPIYENDVVTLERTATEITACGIRSADGGCLGLVTAQPVTNNSTVPNK